MTRVRSDKILKHAQGQPCTARIIGVCNCNWETTVGAHGPDKYRGKGQKTSDHWIAFLCSACHAYLDERRCDNWHEAWLEAIRETQLVLIKAGLIVVTETKTKPRQVKKSPAPMNGGIYRQFGN